MARQGVTAERAFERLRRASQQLNMKLREVAERETYTGDIPPERSAARRDRESESPTAEGRAVRNRPLGRAGVHPVELARFGQDSFVRHACPGMTLV